MRWHHGHSTGVGFLLGITLAQHGILLLIIGAFLGFFGRDLYAAGRGIARLIRERLQPGREVSNVRRLR